MPLRGSVAFVTGIARAQGRAHALALAQEGVDIIGVDRAAPVSTMDYPMSTTEDLDKVRGEIEAQGRRAILAALDVRARPGLQALLADAVAELGRLDVVVANAGVSPPAANVWEIPTDRWDDVVGVNLTGTFNTLAAALPHIRAGGRGGSVIITSSAAALKNAPGLSDYVATKGAVIALAASVANEVAADRIRVNVIAPSIVNTPMVTQNSGQLRLFRPDLAEPTVDDCLEVFRAVSPMNEQWLEPEDIARAVVYLAGDDARWTTGSVIPVDMGAAVRRS
ncbi:mycofactocin-coupled SDR family oxidoreductase [Pseudonocardia sp. ICBG1293]|uniref:mycofactocin-coupled SDR family oxidoreductase n=1 Tax=Pseudonocardia sp. ICBG1293 TaxID=2844382 RepID=UPI001CCAAD9A|nr:mycofactocin-coupled SDR family oxidoreductase [Pseudonocardia sp. ICBG1293]